MKKVVLLGMLISGIGAVVACSSDEHSDSGKSTVVAAVSGGTDTHCGTKVVTVDPKVCNVQEDPPAGDAGAGGGGSDYGPTMNGSEGDDDDCKYHLKWERVASEVHTTSLRPQHEHEEGGGAAGDVSFTVTLTNKKDGSPVTGAPLEIELFLDPTHPAPNTTVTSKEGAPGVYTLGPVAFDVSGKWTARFHIHDDCNDSEESPHGHAAFFVQATVTP